MGEPETIIEASIEASRSLIGQAGLITRVADDIVSAVRRGGRVYLFGNGGSAADAQHLAAELVGRFERERDAIPAVALTTDTSILTSTANDCGYETVFERQVEAHVRVDDVVIGISTSGSSPNVVRALQKAKELGAHTVLLTGATRGAACDCADAVIAVDSDNTARVQEAHILAGHIICYLVEAKLCGPNCGDVHAQ